MKIQRFQYIAIIAFFSLLTLPLQAGQTLTDLSVPLPADLSSFQKIRILILRDNSEVKVSCASRFEVYDDGGKILAQGDRLSGVTIISVPTGLRWWNQDVPTRFFLVQSMKNSIRVGGKGVFRDIILVYKNANGKLDVINELDLEDYLKGVLPFEGNPQWPLESLKTQAVASRTFALTRMIERRGEEYDVHAGVFSQVYAGKQIENERTNEAVDATRGEVLLYKNKLFPAYFHSTCGGATTAADLVWPVKSHPALSGVECRFCGRSPHYKWEAKVTRAEIKEKLAKHGMPVQEVLGIKTGKIDRTGRAHVYIIQSTWAERKVDADAFRVWINPIRLKSNLITKIKEGPDSSFIFRGKGWGHGVGLCQYGMKYLGELGYGYQEILGYYYPGAQISKLNFQTNSSP